MQIMRLFTFIVLMFITINIYASDSEDLIRGKVWNRWTTDDFVICSLSDSQGEYLYNNIEDIKSWIYYRWGMYDVDFSAKCKLICVNDRDLFEKFFRIEDTLVEIRKNPDGSIKETVIFILLDKSASKTIPMPLTEVCLAEFEEKYDLELGFWVHRGMPLLNSSIPNIRQNIKQKFQYDCETIMETTKEQFMNMSVGQKREFDVASMTLCLMLKKEFGTTNFQKIMKETSSGKSPEVAVQKVLGFDNFDDFESSFDRYTKDLVNDIKTSKTPDSYLQIK